MKLGILLNKDRHLEFLVGLARAAIDKGHEVMVFAMDEGTRLLEEDEIVRLAALEEVSISYCSHSAKDYGIDSEAVAADIVCGSQLNNAMMHHEADKIIVL